MAKLLLFPSLFNFSDAYPSGSNESQREQLDDDSRPLTFHGVILRSHLVALLKKGATYAENSPVSYKIVQHKNA